MAATSHGRGLIGLELVKRQIGWIRQAYDGVIDGAPVMIHVVDQDLNIVKVNARWLDVMGYEQSEVIGRKSYEFLTEESRKRALQDIFPLFFRTGSTRSIGVEFVSKEGQVIDALTHAELCSINDPGCFAYCITHDRRDSTASDQAISTIGALEGITQLWREFDEHQPVSIPEHRGIRTDDTRNQWKSGGEALTGRELEVLDLLGSGKSNKEIGTHLSISANTVKFHVENILKKLAVHNRTQAALMVRSGDFNGIGPHRASPRESLDLEEPILGRDF